MKQKRQVAIVHYNTPELIEAAILSLRKHGGQDYQVTVFDNSDKRPFTKKMKGVTVIDNTKGQVLDIEAEIKKFPNRYQYGTYNGWGSDKHMMSIQKLWDIIPDGFLLMDSDVLLKKDVDFMFQEDQCVVGHIQTAEKARNRMGIDRLVPMLCYINVPMCRKCGINYFDPERSWMIHSLVRHWCIISGGRKKPQERRTWPTHRHPSSDGALSAWIMGEKRPDEAFNMVGAAPEPVATNTTDAGHQRCGHLRHRSKGEPIRR